MATWQSMLGITEIEPNVHGSTTDAAKVNAIAVRADNEAVPRVSGEYLDQSNPHPQIGDTNAADSVNADGTTADYTRTHDTEANHDGYGGRGTGKKYTSPAFADR